jgi:beta-galactosidase
MALSHGIEVPYFFSGEHHGPDPAGDHPWDSVGRSNPWYTTEFWTGWFNLYGLMGPDRLRYYDRATWKILAYGGNGFNDYMLYGGSNFAYFNNNEDAASYDYGCGVGQAGDLRPIYYRQKRVVLFARSFQEILETSVNATDDYKALAPNPAIRVTARHSPAGTIAFLDNPTDQPQQTQVSAIAGEVLPATGMIDLRPGVVMPSAGALTLNPGEIMPIVRNFTIAPGWVLKASAARILGIAEQGAATTVVIYGQMGSPVELRFAVPEGTSIVSGGAAWKASATGAMTLATKIAYGAPQEYTLSAGGHRLRILAMTGDLADRTWFVEAGAEKYVICGPHYVSDVDVRNGSLSLLSETSSGRRPAAWFSASDMVDVAYGPGEKPIPLRGAATPGLAARAKAAGSGALVWKAKSAADAAGASYRDADWLASDDPLPMGADGDVTADAWYRTTLTPPSAGTYTLRLGSIRDRANAFLDGVPVPQDRIRANGIRLDLTAGTHSLAVFTAHDGRDKLFGYLGPLDKVDAKGLTGPALLQQLSEGATVGKWRTIPASRDSETAPPAPDAPGWKDYAVGDDAFGNRRGDAWFVADLPPVPAGSGSMILHFESVDDEGTIFLNGKKLLRHEGWNEAFDVPLDGALQDGQRNTLAILVRNNDGAGGLDAPVTLSRVLFSAPVHGWKLRGGPGDPGDAAGWKPLGSSGFTGPAFFKTTFRATPPAEVGSHTILRVTTAGLSHGSVWVNGHNLGRYPERIPVNGLYIPECWLKAGDNALVVYDEEGKIPAQVRVAPETQTSRDVSRLTAVR